MGNSLTPIMPQPLPSYTRLVCGCSRSTWATAKFLISPIAGSMSQPWSQTCGLPEFPRAPKRVTSAIHISCFVAYNLDSE